MPGECIPARHPIRIHATNITGIGATQLVQSLLPALERTPYFDLAALYLPAKGTLGTYKAFRQTTHVVHTRRLLPNALSRILECTVFAGRFEGIGELLVLGDIPLRCRGRQTVFVQTPLLTSGSRSQRKIGAVKYLIARGLFRFNAKFASAFIVQTEAMKRSLSETYPHIRARIHVVGQPAPVWLLASGLRRTGAARKRDRGLRLFYPAADYPHKNHALLGQVEWGSEGAWPIAELVLTVDQNRNPNSDIEWIKCAGPLDSERVLSEYGAADGLLFLSLSESLGFPLLEAMSIGLPIICPDLPYARVLCGNEAIYFAPDEVLSLRAAVVELHRRLQNGWWPDWSEATRRIPSSWSAVASSMLKVAAGFDPLAGA